MSAMSTIIIAITTLHFLISSHSGPVDHKDFLIDFLNDCDYDDGAEMMAAPTMMVMVVADNFFRIFTKGLYRLHCPF